MSWNVVSMASRKTWLPREHSRRNTSITGLLKGPDGKVSIPCVVKDISEAGAKIIPMKAPELSDASTLILPSHDFEVPIEIRWEDPPYAGLSFNYEALS